MRIPRAMQHHQTAEMASISHLSGEASFLPFLTDALAKQQVLQRFGAAYKQVGQEREIADRAWTYPLFENFGTGVSVSPSTFVPTSLPPSPAGETSGASLLEPLDIAAYVPFSLAYNSTPVPGEVNIPNALAAQQAFRQSDAASAQRRKQAAENAWIFPVDENSETEVSASLLTSVPTSLSPSPAGGIFGASLLEPPDIAADVRLSLAYNSTPVPWGVDILDDLAFRQFDVACTHRCPEAAESARIFPLDENSETEVSTSSPTSVSTSLPPSPAGVTFGASLPFPLSPQQAVTTDSATGSQIPVSKRKVSKGKRIHVCTFAFCGKAYTRANHLKVHILSHTGERPFPCEWKKCTWAFARNDELIRHFLCHIGEKNFYCGICDKAFMRSYHLTTHLKGHAKKLDQLWNGYTKVTQGKINTYHLA